MRKLIILCLLIKCITASFSQSTALYDDSRVLSIYLNLHPDSLQEMLVNLENEHYYRAQFIFVDGNIRDTVQDVGLRLRGNTSLNAQKKSFKISFNEYVPGREYQGVRKINLRGSANDPTMIREKLFYDVSNSSGLEPRRLSFVKLYINGLYRGLYTNLEEIDKRWLTRVFGDNNGNLYKCVWPADLAYISDNQDDYKAIFNSPGTPAYDLVTNETADDYSRFVLLVKTLNLPTNASYASSIRQILHVESVLKSLALDVATGNWDDYFYNQNNYYLYDNPGTGKFEFITFDTDNTFGIDWVGQDWATRHCLQWMPTQQNRPLGQKLLAIPEFFNLYVHYLDSITQHVTHPTKIFPRIDQLHSLITPAAEADIFRTLDFGYDIAAFHNGFSQAIDFHTPYGIKPFLQLRRDSTLKQISQLVSNTHSSSPSEFNVFAYPNPAVDWIWVKCSENLTAEPLSALLFDGLGRTVKTWQWEANSSPQELELEGLATGWYRLRVFTKSAHKDFPIVHIQK